MNAQDDVGKVAVGVVDGLRQQPALLALIVLNVIILAAIFFAVKDRTAQQHQQTMAMIERCFPLAHDKR